MDEHEARRERERMERQAQAPPGSPEAPAGSDRATGVDDPTPRAEYRDDPPEPGPQGSENRREYLEHQAERGDDPFSTDVETVIRENLDKDPDQIEIEELDPEYHDGERALDVKVRTGLLGDDLEWLVDTFDVEELYTRSQTKRFGCRCCGPITKTYAEFTIRV